MSRHIPATWYCSGCKKDHPDSRWIEGMEGARKFCAHSIRQGQKEGRNDLPRFDETLRVSPAAIARYRAKRSAAQSA